MVEFQRLARAGCALFPRRETIRACLVIFAMGFPRYATAVCQEKPNIWLDEVTAESHLLAKSDAILPAESRPFDKIQKVVMLQQSTKAEPCAT